MATAKQRANRTAFGVQHGKQRSTAKAQTEREAARLEQYHKTKK